MEMAENDDDNDSDTDDAAEENYFSQLLDSKAESRGAR
jgi:hypothetical protein